MRLELKNKEIDIRLYDASGERIKVVMCYPRTPEYRDKVFGALAELLKIEPLEPAEASAPPRERVSAPAKAGRAGG